MIEIQIKKFSQLIENIEEIKSEIAENSIAWDVLNNLKFGYQNRIKHLKRLQIEKETSNRNSSVCGNGENE